MTAGAGLIFLNRHVCLPIRRLTGLYLVALNLLKVCKNPHLRRKHHARKAPYGLRLRTAPGPTAVRKYFLRELLFVLLLPFFVTWSPDGVGRL